MNKHKKYNIAPDEKIVDILLKRMNDRYGNHHHIILGEYKNNYVSVMITTKKTQGSKIGSKENYPLVIDPLSQGKESYMKKRADVEKKGRYREPRYGKMAFRDHLKAMEYGEKAIKRKKEREPK